MTITNCVFSGNRATGGNPVARVEQAAAWAMEAEGGMGERWGHGSRRWNS